MKNNDWKDRLNVVYSTNPDFGYEMDNDEEQVTLDKDKQNLRVSIDKKNRDILFLHSLSTDRRSI